MQCTNADFVDNIRMLISSIWHIELSGRIHSEKSVVAGLVQIDNACGTLDI